MERIPAQSPRFEARSLDVSVGGLPLLSGINITLEAEGRLLLSGPSGSGKSSLLRVLAGLDAPASGSLKLMGRSPEDLGWPSYRRRVNLLFQRPLFFEMSVAANLELSFAYASAEGGYPAERAAELLDHLGLSSKKLDEDPRKFSVGEQQRLCLLRSLLAKPDLLLLDEPTSALDAESSRRVLDLIERERRERGMAVILAGHGLVWDEDADRLDLADFRADRAS